MDAWITFLNIVLSLVIALPLIGCGMLYAFCPINDKEPSKAHIITTLSVFGALLVALLWGVWK